MLRKILIIIFLLTPLFSLAQKPKERSVKAEDLVFTYPSNMTPEEAKRRAVESAKKQLIENEFGVLIQSHNTTTMTNRNGESQTEFDFRGESSVNGVWIETIGEPKVSWTGGDDSIIVTVSIAGKIREITNNQAEFDVHVLRNGTDLKFKTTDFISGDDFYLYFKSRTGGFLAIYLDDHNGNVIFLSPFYDRNETIPINKNKEYLFYKSESTSIHTDNIKEYKMKCSSSIAEYNTIHVIFSPNNFSLAEAVLIDNNMIICDSATFRIWLTRVVSRDKQVTFKEIPITIKPQR